MSQYPKKNPLSMQLDLSKFTLATEDEKKMADRMRESTSFFKDGMRRLRKNVVSMICLIIIVLLILIALTAVRFAGIDRSAAFLLLPYLLWVTFAGYLNLGIAILN